MKTCATPTNFLCFSYGWRQFLGWDSPTPEAFFKVWQVELKLLSLVSTDFCDFFSGLLRERLKLVKFFRMTSCQLVIATSHDLTRKGSQRREIPSFQGHLGWWNNLMWHNLARCQDMFTFHLIMWTSSVLTKRSILPLAFILLFLEFEACIEEVYFYSPKTNISSEKCWKMTLYFPFEMVVFFGDLLVYSRVIHILYIPWKSKTKQRMAFRMIQIKDSPLYQWAKFGFWTPWVYVYIEYIWIYICISMASQPTPPIVPPRQIRPYWGLIKIRPYFISTFFGGWYVRGGLKFDESSKSHTSHASRVFGYSFKWTLAALFDADEFHLACHRPQIGVNILA